MDSQLIEALNPRFVFIIRGIEFNARGLDIGHINFLEDKYKDWNLMKPFNDLLDQYGSEPLGDMLWMAMDGLNEGCVDSREDVNHIVAALNLEHFLPVVQRITGASEAETVEAAAVKND